MWALVFIIISDFLNRSNNNVEFFHNIQRVSIDTASGVKFDCNERLGRRVYVFHLRFASGIRLCQLRGTKKTTPQRRLQTGRKSSHSGKYHTKSFEI